jgi:choline dehydrogenase-like flavoprotein
MVGGGASGGTLARHLSPSGKSILILERGDRLKREVENWHTAAVFEQNRYVSADTWYDHGGRPFQSAAPPRCSALRYTASAAGSRRIAAAGWDVAGLVDPYEELEPCHTKAEWIYHIHELRGSDPTELPASALYRCAPISNEPRI